jgi:hypothetical protein
MLKKILSLLLCIATVFCVAACGDTSDDTTTTTVVTGEPIIDFPPALQVQYDYRTFEDICEDVDCIVIATYVDAITYSNRYAKFTYNVKESLLGDLSGEIDLYIHAQTRTNCPPYNELPDVYTFYEINDEKHYFYEDGALQIPHGDDMPLTTEFVLFLTREEMVGFDEPQYTWYCAPMVNLTDLSKSTMYNEPLSKHIAGFDMSTATRERSGSISVTMLMTTMTPITRVSMPIMMVMA